jgi:hypothetical protein
MKKLLIAVLALGLVGCNESDEKVIAYGQNEISQNLKDPTSPLFREVFFHKDEKMPDNGVSGYVCGQLNAKNSFGAYIGYSPFYIHVTVKTRWFLPALGVLRGSSDPGILSASDKPEERIVALESYISKCGKR